MRHINKGKEPRELTRYRSSDRNVTYEDFRDKDVLSSALAKEQGYLCAYCMQRIEPDAAHMKIEHWKAQSTHRELQLIWRNMLGVCKGGEGRPRKTQHCDSARGNRELAITPLDHPDQHLRYTKDGEILANRPDFQLDIDTKLNLNVEMLKRSRREVLESVREGLKRTGDSAFTEAALQRQIRRLKQKDGDGKYVPFCQVMIFFLEKKLRAVQEQTKQPPAIAKQRSSRQKGKRA